jgi:hypothetical protein
MSTTTMSIGNEVSDVLDTQETLQELREICPIPLNNPGGYDFHLDAPVA